MIQQKIPSTENVHTTPPKLGGPLRERKRVTRGERHKNDRHLSNHPRHPCVGLSYNNIVCVKSISIIRSSQSVTWWPDVALSGDAGMYSADGAAAAPRADSPVRTRRPSASEDRDKVRMPRPSCRNLRALISTRWCSKHPPFPTAQAEAR